MDGSNTIQPVLNLKLQVVDPKSDWFPKQLEPMEVVMVRQKYAYSKARWEKKDELALTDLESVVEYGSGKMRIEYEQTDYWV